MDYKHSPRSLRSPRFKILPSDLLFTGICVAGALGALFLFWTDLNVTMNRLAGEPVGIVSYKYRAAQRRFVDRVLWDRLKQESPVYEGDFIRTAEMSQATVSLFAGDGRITLEENTLIQILAGLPNGSPGYRINLAEGGVLAEARDGAMSIRSGGTVVEASGSVVNAAAETGGLAVQVLEGSAAIQTGTDTRQMNAGEVFAGTGQNAARVAVTAPLPQAQFLNTGETALPVSFEWSRTGFGNDDRVRLEIAEDRFFTRIINTLTSTAERAEIDIASGVYYWRVFPEREAEEGIQRSGASGRLVIVYAPPPRLVSPAANERFSFKTARPGVRFQWTTGEGAAAYLIEVADNADMQNAVYRSQVQAAGGSIASVVHPGLEPGVWFWRVRPVYPRNYEGQARVSAVGTFRIERTTTLAAPEPQNRQGAVHLEQPGEQYLSWKAEDEAEHYTVLLSRQADLGNPLIQERVRDNYYALDVNAAALAPGQYYWGVYQTDSEGNSSSVSAPRTLAVMEGAPLERAVPAPVVTESIAAVPVTPEAAEPERPIAETIPAAAPSPSARTVPVPRPEGPESLAAPRNLRPGPGYVLTEEIIIRDRQIIFSWDGVADAAEYVFTLVHVTAGNNTEVLRQTLRGTSYTLTDLTLLDAGSFVWRVEAVNLGSGRRSAAAEGRFTVDITEVEGTRVQDPGVMYGNEE